MKVLEEAIQDAGAQGLPLQPGEAAWLYQLLLGKLLDRIFESLPGRLGLLQDHRQGPVFVYLISPLVDHLDIGL